MPGIYLANYYGERRIRPVRTPTAARRARVTVALSAIVSVFVRAHGYPNPDTTASNIEF